MFRSLSFRLSLGVGLALLVGLSTFLYFSMRHHERALLAVKREEAHLLSETVKASLVWDMIQGLAGRESIHQVIREIGKREEIERVRLFNAVGHVQYSSDPDEIGTTVNKDAENCRQCHSTEPPLKPSETTERTRFFYTPASAEEGRHRVLGVVNPIYNERERGCGNCHEAQTVLGVLDVVVSLDILDRDLKAHRSALAIFGILGVGGIIGVVGLLIRFLVHRPIADLLEGARKVGRLDLDYRLPADRKDELGNLARAFNDMTARLQRAQKKVLSFSGSLEEKVEEKTAELRKAQEQMVRSEKMAAIGQMAAGVAHEMNNPLTGVITFAHLLKRKLDPETQEAQDLQTIINEAKRCSEIARGLLDFARSEELVRRVVDLNRLMDRVLALVEHQPLFHNIEIIRAYEGGLPTLALDEGRVEQVLLNLVMNAAEAMDGRGRLTITTHRVRGSSVMLSVSDTGPGIPELIRSRVFDPFFTTKEAGHGTGLGLAVSFRIVEDHGGRFEVDESPEGGAHFRVFFPLSGEGGDQ